MARILSSRHTVVTLLSLLLLFCVAGVTIPQRNSVEYPQWKEQHPALVTVADLTGIDHAFTSPAFLVLVAAVSLSALVSILTRAISLRRGLDGKGISEIVRRRYRLIGSLTFHAGLLGVVFAGVASSLTRSEGNLVVTEGQSVTVSGPHVRTVKEARLERRQNPDFEVRLDRFHPVYEGRFGTPDYASDLTVIENGREVRKATVRVNEPLRHRGVTLNQQVHGFSPLIVLRDEAGRARFGSWVALNTDLDSDSPRYLDDFQIPGSTLAVEAELFPDAYVVGNRLANRSPEPRNPVLAVTVRDGPAVLYEGPVRQGNPVRLKEGLLLSLEGVRYWTGFDTVRDSGARALFWSAWIAVAGLCIRFAPRRFVVPRKAEAR